MTFRLIWVALHGLLSTGFFLAAIFAQDPQKRQTRLLFAIYFALVEINSILGAIAVHTGAYPLWNNK